MPAAPRAAIGTPAPTNPTLPPLPDSALLLAWYDRHRRVMPWRARPGEAANPYHVWLSEIMLQQTTVAAVGPYFARFLAQFPTVEALAEAPEPQIMAAWAGLGYYARARNLHACAKAVAGQGGKLPADLDKLRALPGIGPYTARAVAAIAFNIPVVPVDGNVERVLSRLCAISTPLPAAKPLITALADSLATQHEAAARPADFAQALFDLGATICTRRPACALCPFVAACAAHRAGIAADLPRKAVKPPRPIRHGAAFFLTDSLGQVLLRRRPPSGLLGGMTELPGTPWTETLLTTKAALAHAPMLAAWQACGEIRHVFTHFELRLRVFAAAVARIDAEGFLRPRSALEAEALPSLMRKAVGLAAHFADAAKK